MSPTTPEPLFEDSLDKKLDSSPSSPLPYHTRSQKVYNPFEL